MTMRVNKCLHVQRENGEGKILRIAVRSERLKEDIREIVNQAIQAVSEEAFSDFEKRMEASQYPEGSACAHKNVVTSSKGSASDIEDDTIVYRMAGSGRHWMSCLVSFHINGARKKRRSKSALWQPASVIVTQSR